MVCRHGVPFQQFSTDDWSAVPTASPLSMEEQPLSGLKLILSTDSSTESGNKIDGKQAISTSFFFFFSICFYQLEANHFTIL